MTDVFCLIVSAGTTQRNASLRSADRGDAPLQWAVVCAQLDKGSPHQDWPLTMHHERWCERRGAVPSEVESLLALDLVRNPSRTELPRGLVALTRGWMDGNMDQRSSLSLACLFFFPQPTAIQLDPNSGPQWSNAILELCSSVQLRRDVCWISDGVGETQALL